MKKRGWWLAAVLWTSFSHINYAMDTDSESSKSNCPNCVISADKFQSLYNLLTMFSTPSKAEATEENSFKRQDFWVGRMTDCFRAVRENISFDTYFSVDQFKKIVAIYGFYEGFVFELANDQSREEIIAELKREHVDPTFFEAKLFSMAKAINSRNDKSLTWKYERIKKLEALCVTDAQGNTLIYSGKKISKLRRRLEKTSLSQPIVEEKDNTVSLTDLFE